MILLGFLYTKWGFYGDDYLNLYYATKPDFIKNIIKGDPNIYNIPPPVDYVQKETF